MHRRSSALKPARTDEAANPRYQLQAEARQSPPHSRPCAGAPLRGLLGGVEIGDGGAEGGCGAATAGGLPPPLSCMMGCGRGSCARSQGRRWCGDGGAAEGVCGGACWVHGKHAHAHCVPPHLTDGRLPSQTASCSALPAPSTSRSVAASPAGRQGPTVPRAQSGAAQALPLRHRRRARRLAGSAAAGGRRQEEDEAGEEGMVVVAGCQWLQ